MNPLFDKANELTMTVLGYASKFGHVLERFSGRGETFPDPE